jgi:hypothetical protein
VRQAGAVLRLFSPQSAGESHSADEISKPADLRDRGVISGEDFQQGKVQLLG